MLYRCCCRCASSDTHRFLLPTRMHRSGFGAQPLQESPAPAHRGLLLSSEIIYLQCQRSRCQQPAPPHRRRWYGAGALSPLSQNTIPRIVDSIPRKGPRPDWPYFPEIEVLRHPVKWMQQVRHGHCGRLLLLQYTLLLCSLVLHSTACRLQQWDPLHMTRCTMYCECRRQPVTNMAGRCWC